MSKQMNLRSYAVARVLFCGLALAVSLPCWAATLTVTNTNDSGAGSLRDAIASAGTSKTTTSAGRAELWPGGQ